MTGGPHAEMHLQFGMYDRTVDRSDLHCWTTDKGRVIAAWLYGLHSMSVSVLFAQAGQWERRPGLSQPLANKNSTRLR
jgi:hypothetical protein